MSFVEQIIRKAYSWLREVPDLPIDLKIQWNKILSIIYEDKIPAEQILLFSSQDVNTSSFERLNKEELIEAMSLIAVLVNYAQTSQDPKGTRLLKEKLEHLIAQNDVSQDELKPKVKEFDGLLDGAKKRKSIRIPASIKPLVVDHLLRWILLFVYIEFSLEGYIFLSLNFIAIPLVIIFYFIKRHQKLSVNNNQLIQVYAKGKKVHKNIQISAFQWVVLGLMVITGVMISYLHINENDILLGVVLTFLLFLIYYSLYLKIWGEGELEEKDLNLQFQQKEINPERLSPELNDEIIIEKSVELKSITGKLDSYVLESALFGALAFSGFLQIMAENLISFDDLEAFGIHLFDLFRSFAYLDGEKVSDALTSLSSKQDLFSLISLETLICSALFLIVIASRLRFTDKADEVEKHLELAKTYNEKEERYLDKRKKEGSEEKIVNFNRKIAEQLIEGNRILDKMRPILSYMRHFRNAGILTFFIVLISSALFISSFISWLIASIAFISYLYFNRQELQNSFDKIIYRIRSLFVTKGYYFLWLSIALFVIGFFSRTILKFENTDFLINTSFILIGLYAFTWITFIPHIDHKFEGSSSPAKEISWWFTIRLIWGLAFFLTTIGFAFSLTSWFGANFALGFGILILSIVLMIAGNYMSKSKSIGIILGSGLIILTVGTIFKSAFMPFAQEIMGIGYMTISILIAYLNFTELENKFLAAARTLGLITLMWVITLDIFNYIPEEATYLLLLIFGLVLAASYIFAKPTKRIFHKVYLTSVVFLIVISQVFLTITRDYNSFELAYDNYTINFSSINKIHELKILTRTYSAGYVYSGHPMSAEERKEYSEYLDWYLNVTGDRIVEDHGFLINRLMMSVSHFLHLEDSATREDMVMGEFLAHYLHKTMKSMGYNHHWFRAKGKWWDTNDYLLIHYPNILKGLGKEEEAKKVASDILKSMPEIPEELKAELRKF